MIRACKGESQPEDPDPAEKVLPRYLVYVRARDRWEIADWGGKRKGWSIAGVPLNPVCWCPLPAKIEEGRP